MVDGLLEALQRAERESEVRCLILTGAGKIFSAGQDVGELAERNLSFRHHLQVTYSQIVLRMRRLEKPILVAINGPTAGTALGLALTPDLRLAAESARFFFGFSGIGLTADSGTSLALPLSIGLARTSEMAFTNEPLPSEQARELSLVNHVVPDDDRRAAVDELAVKLAEGPTRAIGLTNRAFNQSFLAGLEGTLDYEAHLQDVAGQTEDHTEGISAFQERRAPEFKGR